MERVVFPCISLLAAILLWIARGSLGKVCTNTGLQSHTLRALTISHPSPSPPTSALTIHPRNTKGHQTHDPEILRSLQEALQKSHNESFLQAVSLHNVSLAPNSPQGIAQHTNLRYLMMLDVDSLVWNFRQTAGLEAQGSPYGGWEDPTSELRGHFVGHYLSATALMWASTHEDALVEKMNALVNVLADCQNKIGTGYLSGFPSELFDRFEALKTVWAPYYTIHKILAGLLDQYTYVGNQKAFKMVLWMVEYFFDRVQLVIKKHTIERHWQSLNEETGGMNDVLYRLYGITGNSQHLTLAHLFDKPCFLGMLAVGADSLSNFHSNTHIPVVVGAQMRYEMTGDKQYKDIAEFFLTTINSSHRYVTGGTSVGEFWIDPNRLGDALETEDEESCTTYNMLKIVRNLFRWTKKIIYADYYERALLNGVLSIQRGQEPGVMIYMLPLGPGNSKARSYHGWGKPFGSFWCCYGTGIESFSKLGDSIYFEEERSLDNLYVIQFVSSTLYWEKAMLSINQSVVSATSNNPMLQVTFRFSTSNKVKAIFNVRVPSWTTFEGCSAFFNGKSINVTAPGTFLRIKKTWVDKDEIALEFPMILATEKVQDDRLAFASLHAVLFGPYVLAGLSDGGQSFGSVMNLSSVSSWILPVAPSDSSQLYTFSLDLPDADEARSNVTDSQKISNQSTFVLAQNSESVVMDKLPSKGTDSAVKSTFCIVTPVAGIHPKRDLLAHMDYLPLNPENGRHMPSENSISKVNTLYSSSNLLYRTVSLELFNKPGSFLAHQAHDGSNITIMKVSTQKKRAPSDTDLFCLFNILPGLSGEGNKISFEAAGLPGCYIYGSINVAKHEAVQLRCKGSTTDAKFNHATSFSVNEGLASYHPMSFIAYGATENYLLYPLSAYKDESYTVYFDMGK